MIKHPRRSLILVAYAILLGVWVWPVYAQNTLIVASDGAYTSLEAALAAAQDGDIIEVHGGTYPAPFVVDKRVSLIGVDQPIIDGQGTGSLVIINAAGVLFSGFKVQNSGDNLAHEDTAIVVQATDVIVRDNVLENVMFGIYFADAARGIAQRNSIHGKPIEESIRGDGIRVWYSNDVQLLDNEIISGRDTLIWYADNITIRGNHIHRNRYGLHFMYNKNATVQDNIIENNAVGAYMMYSAHMTMTGNRFINNRGASGYAIALKDMDYAQVTDNLFIANVVAIYLDNSPSLVDINNTISNNFIAYNDIGLIAMPSVQRNIFQGNTFLENHQQVSVQGRGNLLGNQWSKDGIGNYWSDYVGYDRAGDGVGDMPYRSEKLFDSLMDSHSALRLFTFSPASQAIDFAAAAFPSLRPDPKVIDDVPQMHYTLPSGVADGEAQLSWHLLIVTVALLAVGVGICGVALRGDEWRKPAHLSTELLRVRA